MTVFQTDLESTLSSGTYIYEECVSWDEEWNYRSAYFSILYYFIDILYVFDTEEVVSINKCCKCTFMLRETSLCFEISFKSKVITSPGRFFFKMLRIFPQLEKERSYHLCVFVCVFIQIKGPKCRKHCDFPWFTREENMKAENISHCKLFKQQGSSENQTPDGYTDV